MSKNHVASISPISAYLFTWFAYFTKEHVIIFAIIQMTCKSRFTRFTSHFLRVGAARGAEVPRPFRNILLSSRPFRIILRCSLPATTRTGDAGLGDFSGLKRTTTGKGEMRGWSMPALHRRGTRKLWKPLEDGSQQPEPKASQNAGSNGAIYDFFEQSTI